MKRKESEAARRKVIEIEEGNYGPVKDSSQSIEIKVHDLESKK